MDMARDGVTPLTVINLFAGPGAGKSTTAAGVFALLKLHGVNCELVREYAKELVWAGVPLTQADQPRILAEQYRRQRMLVGRVAVVITDSPLLVSLHYGDPDDPALRRQTLTSWDEFANHNYFLWRAKPYEPAGRLQNEDEARDIDYAMYDLLGAYCGQWMEVKGDEQGINTITQQVLFRHKRPLRYRMRQEEHDA